MSKKVVIDAGHGGTDSGAVGNGIIEKDFTLKISKYIASRLEDLGVTTALVRKKDETLSPDERVKKVQAFFGSGNDVVVVSNHINAGGGEGAEIIYALRNKSNLSQKIASEFTKSGQIVRKYYQRRLPSNPAKDYYFLLRDTPNNETVLIEYGFLDNEEDAKKLKDNWQEYAEAVVTALANYLGVKYVAPVGSNTYVVKSGDSLWNIAKKYNTSVDALKSLNNLTSNLLSVGQVLKILSKEQPEIITEEITYTVKKGDTLYDIANSYNTTVSKLKELNNLSSNNLSVGQILIINKGSKSDVSANKYTVKSGDNLYALSKMFGVTVDEIKQANGLTSNSLSIGQILTIPTGTKKTSNIYTVKKGDTLYSIARQHNTTVTDLQNLNNLSTSVLSVGQKLIVP